MENEKLIETFKEFQRENADCSSAIGAIQILSKLIDHSTSRTLTELVHELKLTGNLLTKNSEPSSSSSVKSASEMFLQFIISEVFEGPSFDECREKLRKRARIFVEQCQASRKSISMYGRQFLVDENVILTHSYSRVVFELLRDAAKSRRFTVFVTNSEPDRTGLKMRDQLESIGIPAVSILDASVAFIIERVSFVLVGAEAVVESGGIINKIGTFNIAIAAKEMNKPFYVATETFKFVRQFPLNNRDLPEEFKTSSINEFQHSRVDYTPPSYITLLFTDIGPLTPAAVSDELIKIFM